ncbi:MAG: hypothetical protein J7K23_07195 [Thermoproteales archaeon]|nr:hypothetical protein [Thermoproteales archaeon]
MSKILDLLRLEYDLTWRYLTLGMVYALIFIAYTASLNVTTGILTLYGGSIVYLQDVASSYMYSFFLLIGLSSYIYSKSIASQISNGLIKTILCYPISRRRLLITKLVTNYLVFLPSGILPELYLQFLYGVDMKVFIALILVFAVKLLFSSTLAILFSVILREPLMSLIGSMLTLYTFEIAPGFLWSIHAEKIAKMLSLNYLIVVLYRALSSPNFLKTIMELDALATVLFSIVFPCIFFLSSLFLFEKMDLD